MLFFFCYFLLGISIYPAKTIDDYSRRNILKIITFSVSYSSINSFFSSSGRSLHIWPIIFPISHSFNSGFCAFTVSHTLRLYRIYGIKGFSGGLGGFGVFESFWKHILDYECNKAILCLRTYFIHYYC